MYPNIYMLEKAANELSEERLREVEMDRVAAMAKESARQSRRSQAQAPRSQRRPSLLSPLRSRLLQILRG